jgi:hypothetical protein
MSATRPPLNYLITCSQMSLESIELSRLNLASNLRKEFQQILEEWIDSEVDARLARSILEWRRAHNSPVGRQKHEPAESPQFQQLAMAFLPEGSEPPASDSLEHGPRSSQADSRVAPSPCPSSEVAQSTFSSLRWTSLAKAAAASLGAIADLDECQPKKLHGLRKLSPLVKADGQMSDAGSPIFQVRATRNGTTSAMKLLPLRGSCGTAHATVKTSSAVRPRARQRNPLVAPAVRTIFRRADVRRRSSPPALCSGTGVALRIAIADAS